MDEESSFTKYRISEIEQHKEKNSIWIIIRDSVYDVTKFIEEHPGGEEVLIDKGGSDATQDFEDTGHSKDARDLMKEFKIGEVHEDDRKPVQKEKEKNKPGKKKCSVC